jgi:hypothetical protein
MSMTQLKFVSLRKILLGKLNYCRIPGDCTIKLFTAVIIVLLEKARVFDKAIHILPSLRWPEALFLVVCDPSLDEL